MELFIVHHALLIVGALFALGGGLLFGNVNQLYTGTPTSRRQVSFPSSIVSGQPLLVGATPCVTLDSYQSNVGGATCEFGGSFVLTVVGQSGSPLTGHKINPGDKLYADGGTLDAATNVTYGFTLNADATYGTFFGFLDPTGPAVGSGVTALANVLLPSGM